jgi:hypothetical protein
MALRFHIENLPWFVFVPVAYLLVTAFGLLLEQYSSLKMPPGHGSDTGSKCRIFKSVELSQQDSLLNFTVGLQTRFVISLSQAWRSVRVRLSGSVGEILRSRDVNSHGVLNSTDFYVTFYPSISGRATVGVYCSDFLLKNYSVILPSDLPPGFRQTFYGDAWLRNVCLRRGVIQIFTDRIVSPLSIRGWTTAIVPDNFQANQTKAIHLKVPVYYDGFPGDIVAAALLVPLSNPGAVVTTYGDKELSGHLWMIHPSFRDRESTSICVSRFEYGHRLKRLRDFEREDFEMLRTMWEPSDGERMPGIVTIDREADDLSGFVEVPYASLSPRNVTRAFRQIAPLVVPFQTSPSLLAFVSGDTKVIVIRPTGFACRSLLEEMIERTGLEFSVANCTLTSEVDCDETCACISAARCGLNRSAVVQSQYGFVSKRV